jgi:Deacetylases, including yeast histone deacetylase and acetoin utilization protein
MSADRYLYYDDEKFDLYDFGPGHYFSPLRQRLTTDLLEKAGLLPETAVTRAVPATVEELLLFHTPEYIAVIRADGQTPNGPVQRWGIGTSDNPLFRRMHEAAALRVGATLAAARQVIEGRAIHAVNFAGGLHHAHPSKASGFCIYNDIAVAIAWLRREYDLRVAYVDLDAHHGDGVQWGFYDDPNVLTISIHESGRYLFPGTGEPGELGDGPARGTKVNIPLLPHTGPKSWLECFELVVPAVLEAFRPDILITQHGCDAHRYDPLTHLAISTQSMEAAARRLHELAHELCDGRWIALGGGGYSIWDVVPRAWAAVWAVVTDQALPPAVPETWRKAWAQRVPGRDLPDEWHDLIEELPPKDGEDIENEWRHTQNRRVAKEVLETVTRLLRAGVRS